MAVLCRLHLELQIIPAFLLVFQPQSFSLGLQSLTGKMLSEQNTNPEMQVVLR